MNHADRSEVNRRVVTDGDGRRYMLQLDGLRFFAVIGVLLLHYWNPPLPWVFKNVNTGLLGVLLFFVLSGFLITGILLGCRALAEGDGRGRLFLVRQFYVKRFLRIFPIYYLTLFVLLAVGIPEVRRLWPWLFSYATNLYIAHHLQWLGSIGHFWTLAVEEQFYVVWLWLMLFAPRRWLIPIICGFIALAPIYRSYAVIVHWSDFTTNNHAAGTFTAASLDSLGAGALLALLLSSRENTGRFDRYLGRIAVPIAASVYMLLLTTYYYGVAPKAFAVFGNLCVVVVFAWLVGGAARGLGGIAGSALEARPIRYVGKISYGVYIYHPFIPRLLVFLARHRGLRYHSRGFVNFVVSTALTILVASASWRFVERPINRLKRHFSYRRSTSARAPLPESAPVPVD
jgi:peptidoglycan/LPS O-acetylase OafA/YrhL